jgi:hypothetical protein
MENLKLYTIKEIDYWIDDFEKTLLKIENSNDPKRVNYSKKRFNLNDQKDMSIIYDENDKLVAFSSVFSSPIYPNNCYRILNRFWKDESVRWHGYVSITMLRHQVEVCKNLNAKAGFISTEGHRSRWLKNWIDRAIIKGFDFKQVNGMAKVCNGNYKTCWQNVGYLMIDKNEEEPNFEYIDYELWKLMVDYDQ